MPSIADTFVTVMPETRQIASGIVRAFREVDPRAREAGERWGREIERGIGTPRVELQADTTRARAEIDEAARDRRSTVHVDVDRDRLNQLGSALTNALVGAAQDGMSRMGPQLAGSASSAGTSIGSAMGSPMSAALVAAGAAAVAGIASALSGLAGLVPAGLVGAGGLVGTLVVGLDGVKDAYDAVNKAADSSGREQADKAKQVTSAQNTLTDAVQSQAQAQRDVAGAYRDARQNLDDLNLSLQGGKISEAQAYNNVLKARRDLAQGNFKDELELRDGQLRVASAEQSWQESKQRNVELQEKTNDANSKGVENSDKVVAANERLRRTNEQVAEAQQKLNTAQSEMSSSAQSALDAMSKLSPQGQALVNTLMSMKPALMDFKNSVQDALLMNLGPQIQQLSSTYLPLLQGFMTSMATTMNQTFTQLSQFLMQPQTLAMMQTVFDNLSESFSVFMQAAQPATEAFLKFTEVGSGFLPQLAQMAVDAANAFNKFAQSGDLQKWIQTGVDALGELAKLLPTIMHMFGDLAPIGMATLQGLNQILTALAPAIAPLAQAFSAFLTAITPVLTLVAQFVAGVVQALAPALTQWFNAMAPVIQQLSTALMPIIQSLMPVLGQLATVLVTAMVQGIQTILPYLGPFVQAFSELLAALLPLLPSFVQLAISALPAFQQAIAVALPFITDILRFLTSLAQVVVPAVIGVIKTLSDTFGPAWEKISGAVSTAWNVVKPIFELMKTAITNITTPLGKLFDMASKIPGVGNLLAAGDPGRGGGYVPKTPGAPAGPAAKGAVTWSKPSTGSPSSKQEIANLIVGEAMKRGYSAQEAQSILAYSIGESSLNPGISGGVQGDDEVVGLFQEKGAFARSGGIDPAKRADPLSNVTAYLNQLEAHRRLPIEQALPATSVGGPLASGPGSAPQAWGPLMAQAAALMPDTSTTATVAAPTTMPATAAVLPPTAPTTPIPGSIPTMSSLPDAHGAHPQIAEITAIAEQFGLKLTAGKNDHSVDGGFHPKGEAGDFSNGSGNTPQMEAFAEYMAQNFGPMIQELIYSDPKFNNLIGGGKNVSGTGYYSSGTLSEHENHVHVALKDEMAAAFQQSIGGAAPAAGSPSMPSQTMPTPIGNEQDPLYVTLPPSAQKDSGGGQLGQDFVGGILQEFGLDGSVLKDPTQFGLFKLFKGVMGLKPASGGGAGGTAGPGGGGGGDFIGSLLNGVLPQAFGPLRSGSPTDAPGEFMPLMPGSGGGGGVNIPALATSGQTGAPGPGNVVDNSINISGVPNPGPALDAANQANVPRMRQGMRPLPG